MVNSSLQKLMLWGFQGTVDYRFQLQPEEFMRLGYDAPAADLEVFVSPGELAQVMSSLAVGMSRPGGALGGSPLISAVRAQEWISKLGMSASMRSCFVGVLPVEAGRLLPPSVRGVVEFAEFSNEIRGTICLENIAHSTKLMLSVPRGRWLNQELLAVGINGIRRALLHMNGAPAALGIGGINKADPPVLIELIEFVRKITGLSFVFLSGSSFKPALDGQQGDDYWPVLFKALSLADALSLSEEEFGQLQSRWGEGWPEEMLRSGRLRLIICHAPTGVFVRSAPGCEACLPEVEDMLEAARGYVAAVSAEAVTGRGACFDGVISAHALMGRNARPQGVR